MDTVQITIRGRNYTLRTDEKPERISQIAAALDERIAKFSDSMKGRAETEVLTLVAFDLSEESDSSLAEAQRMKELLLETEVKNKQLLIENMNSAESELYQIAVVKEQENSDLRAKIQEYEQMWETQVADTYTSAEQELGQIVANKEKENDELRNRLVEFEKQIDTHAMGVLNSAIDEAKEVAETKEAENQRLISMLDNFEKTFDDFAKAKEREIVRMQEENESLKQENEALKMKLAECSEDGQMTLV